MMTVTTKSFGLARGNQWKLEGGKLYISTYNAAHDEYSEWSESNLAALSFSGDINAAWNWLLKQA